MTAHPYIRMWAAVFFGGGGSLYELGGWQTAGVTALLSLFLSRAHLFLMMGGGNWEWEPSPRVGKFYFVTLDE